MKKTISSILLCVMLILSLCSGMLTVFATETLSVLSVSGDIHNIYINFDKDISESTNASEKISVTNNGESVDIVCVPTDSTLKITPQSGDFEADVTYRITIESGFGTDIAATESKIEIDAENKSIFSENFDTITKADLGTKFTVQDGTFYNALASVQNGALWYGGNYNLYMNVPDIATLENYSVSFNYKRYERGDFAELNLMFFETASITPGYLIRLTKMSPGHLWSGYRDYTLESRMNYAGTVVIGGDGGYNGNPVITETTPENNYDLSFVKKGMAVEAYYESDFVCSYDFSSKATQADAKLGFKGAGGRTNSLIDNLVVTTFESTIYEEKTATLESIDGDIHNVILTFSEDMTGTENVSEKVVLREGTNPVAYDYTVSGNTIKLTAKNAKFEADKTYILEVESGIGTEFIKTEEAYLRAFKNKSIFSENFDTITKADLGTKFTVQGGTFYNALTSVQNGALWYGGEKNLYLNVADIATLENYSVSFNYKRYERGDLAPVNLMFFETSSNTPGYLISLASISPGYLWNAYKNNTLTTAMEYAGTAVGGDGGWNGNPVITETNPENNYDLSFVKKGMVVDAYYESGFVGSYDFTGKATASEGKLGFKGYGSRSNVLIDNLVVTTFVSWTFEEKTATLESIDGDIHNVILTFSEDMTGTENVSEKVIIRDGADTVDFDYTVSADTIKLSPRNSSFEADKLYIIEIESGIGTEFTKTEEAYIRGFKNNVIFSENFDTITKAELGTKFTVQDGTFYNALTSVQNGSLWYNGEKKLYLTVPDIETLENYSVSFNYKRFYGKETQTHPLNVFFFDNGTALNGYSIRLTSIKTFKDRYSSNSDAPANALNPAMDYAGTVSGISGWNDKPVLAETAPENNYDVSFVKKGMVVDAYYESGFLGSYNFASKATQADSKLGFDGADRHPNSLIDNIVITTFESVNLEDLIFGGIKIMDTKGTVETTDDTKITTTSELQSALGIKGTAYVGNFSGVKKPVVIVVAMYDGNNKMISAKIALNEAVEDGISCDYPFEFDKNSEAVKVRGFVFDSFANLSPYENAAQVPNN